MTDSTLVSVIIPAYNHEGFVSDALRSVMAQTHERLELIVIDDGSTDATYDRVQALLPELSRRFVRVETGTQPNMGSAATITQCLARARGELVFLLDSDDVALPHAIERLIPLMRPSVALAVGDNAYIDAAHRPITMENGHGRFATLLAFHTAARPEFDVARDFGTYASLIAGNYVPNGWLLRPQAVAAAGGYVPGVTLDDWPLLLRLAKRFDIVFAGDVLAHYRVHEANTNRVRGEALFLDTARILLQEREYCIAHGLQDTWWEHARAVFQALTPDQLEHSPFLRQCLPDLADDQFNRVRNLSVTYARARHARELPSPGGSRHVPAARGAGQRIDLYALCWNDARVLPFFFRHYDPFVHRYVIFDDGSTDGSLEILRAHSGVEVRPFTHEHPDSFVLSEIAHYDTCWKESRGRADWVMVVDLDEHLWHPDLAQYLRDCQAQGITALPALGFEMVTEEFPDAQDRLCDTHTYGAPASDMCKLALFAPAALAELHHAPGGHGSRPVGQVIAPAKDSILLLHYKWLGRSYPARRHEELAARRGRIDVEQGWGHHWTAPGAEQQAAWDRYRRAMVDVTALRSQPSAAFAELPDWLRALPRLVAPASSSGTDEGSPDASVLSGVSGEVGAGEGPDTGGTHPREPRALVELRDRNRSLEQAVRQLSDQLGVVARHAADLEQSRSWRWTAPVRRAIESIGGAPSGEGNELTRTWEFCLESPVDGAVVHDAIEIAGWAFNRRSPLIGADVTVDDGTWTPLECGRARSDVAAAYPLDAVEAPGFRGRVLFPHAGTCIVKVRLRAADGSERRIERTIEFVGVPADTEAARPSGDASLRSRLETLAREWEWTLGRSPTILDLTAARRVPAVAGLMVFGPVTQDELPYLDRTVDVVAVDAGAARLESEAARIAGRWLIECAEQSLTVHAVADHKVPDRCVSIIVPVHGHWALTHACLEQIWRVADAAPRIEVVVVDDASPDETARELDAMAAGEPRLRIVPLPANRGFSAACNAGAAAASGDVLVFLNNDTLPQPGWLAPLVHALDTLPHAGAVGARLVGADGRLQEAGGVVFSDGSAWNLGRGADCDDPLFARVRAVDYCSAAALATTSVVWRDLGGFDEAYSPAYYEDTDFCFRVRSSGREVYVQPRSTVVHIEGGTAGTDESRGVKAHQALNRRLFAQRWATALQDQPSPPVAPTRARLRSLASRGVVVRPRVLIVSPGPAEFDRESGSRRVYHLLRQFRQHAWEVVFIAQHDTGDLRYARALRDLGIETWAGPDTPRDGAGTLRDPRALLRESPFDLALVHFWHLAERYLPLIRQEAPQTPVVVDSVDLHMLRHFRNRFASREPLTALEGADAARELNVYAGCDRVLTVSAKEAAMIDDFLGRPGHAHVLPDTEELHPAGTNPAGRHGVVFVANFRHPPNVEALEWFVGNVLARLGPGFLHRHPVSVVGNEVTSGLIRRCGGDRQGVRWVGWVPEIEPYLAAARVAIVPVRSGAGTKRKVVQALMLGTPVVTTTVGAEGLDLVDGEHALIADAPDAFARAMTALASDDALWTRLAAEGARHARTTHGPAAALGSFERLLALARHTPRTPHGAR